MSANALGAGGRALASGSAAAAVAALVFVGKLTTGGSITLPAGTKSALVKGSGVINGGGQLNMTVNGLGAGYTVAQDGGASAAAAAFTVANDYQALTGAEFTFSAEVGLTPTNAYARWAMAEIGPFWTGDQHWSGYVATGSLSTLGFAAAALGAFTVDVWALVETS